MNKMVKGAIATGVGVILLAGGGGTLAVWNTSNTAQMGEVASGDLDMVPGTGVWTNAVSDESINIGDYKVVPGDILTYTQTLDVTLDGDLIAANLAVEMANGSAFDENATVSPMTLTNTAGDVLPTTTLTASGEVTASTTFTFDRDTEGRDATAVSHDLGEVTYTLTQVAPATAPPATPAVVTAP